MLSWPWATCCCRPLSPSPSVPVRPRARTFRLICSHYPSACPGVQPWETPGYTVAQLNNISHFIFYFLFFLFFLRFNWLFSLFFTAQLFLISLSHFLLLCCYCCMLPYYIWLVRLELRVGLPLLPSVLNASLFGTCYQHGSCSSFGMKTRWNSIG